MTEEQSFKPENCPYRAYDRVFERGHICNRYDRYCNDSENPPKWCPIMQE